MSSLSFTAMGTTFHMHVDAEPVVARAALADARWEVERLEQVFSRFRDDSELSVLNRSRVGRAGRDMLRVVREALALREATDGWFDPCVGAEVIAAGYDRPFDRMAGRVTTATAPPRRGALFLDPATGDLILGAGTLLDLGGIAKGDAADTACAMLARHGRAVVSAGGDVVAHVGCGGTPWPVGVDAAGEEMVLLLSQGAIASSGVDRRVWATDHGAAHHVIDPSTGRPALTDLVRVTVAAVTGRQADAVATAMLAAGRDRARAMVDRLGIDAVMVGADGTCERTGGWA